jgi:hypothetical protein
MTCLKASWGKLERNRGILEGLGTGCARRGLAPSTLLRTDTVETWPKSVIAWTAVGTLAAADAIYSLDHGDTKMVWKFALVALGCLWQARVLLKKAKRTTK